MTKDEFIKKYKDFQLPNETQEMIDKSVDNAKSVLNQYELEYNKIQKSFKFYFKKKGYIKPYDTHDFFDWIAEKYPDASLPHIIEVAKDPNSYKRFHEYKQQLADGSEKNKNELEIFENLDVNQVQAIGLLIRSGIIDYLREKNPNISNNKIAGFIQLITKENLKQSSINPHLSRENWHYPIKNKNDKDDLDFILSKYGISPQSE